MNTAGTRRLKERLKDLRCRYQGHRNRALFDGVEKFCLFVGYPRSGHTLVGAFVDAHPDAVISLGGHLPFWLDRGFSRNHIYALVMQHSQARVNKPRFRYRIDNQWQGGRYRRLRIIGDKRAGEASRMFAANLELLDRLQATVGVPVKVVHVVRNPYDNITTISRKHDMSLADSIDYYFYMCAAVRVLMARFDKDDWITIYHEDIVTEPATELKRLFQFLSLGTDDDFLDDCARIVYQVPHRSRHEGGWTTQLRNTVDERMAEYALLADYTFDG